MIVALQETHIDQDNLKYMWKGKYTFTSSLGAKGGLITLLSDNVIILEQIDKDNEIQIILIEFLVNNESKKFVIVNLHSPCAQFLFSSSLVLLFVGLVCAEANLRTPTSGVASAPPTSVQVLFSYVCLQRWLLFGFTAILAVQMAVRACSLLLLFGGMKLR